MEKILRLRETLSTVGFSRSTLYSEIAKGRFPKPIRLSRRTSGWRLSDIQNWIRQKAEEAR